MKFLLLIALLASNFAFAQTSGGKSTKSKRAAKARATKPLPPKKKKLDQEKTADKDEPGDKPHLESSNSFRITYGYAAWNKSPTKVEDGSMIMREGATGRLVQIHLVESEPDSAIFSGLYSINFQNLEKLKVEFYVPPQHLLSTVEGMKKIAQMIATGQMLRNPFILRRAPTGAQSIEIFDTREQAQAAIKVYRAEQQLQGLQNAKFPSDQQVEMGKLTKEMKEREAAAKAATDRVRLEQLEAQRLAALLAKDAMLSNADRDRREKEGAQFAAEAMKHYAENKFAEAAAKFEKAVELDPDNKSFFLRYGVALSRIENYNKSLIYLSLATGPDVNQAEKFFFIGLNQMRLKDQTAAVQAFDKVVELNAPELSQSALLYKGVVLFEGKKWEPAKEAFQKVLDTSTDPQIDKTAEAYLENILRVQQFEAERSRKWQLSATIGEQYDSNITLASDSSLSGGTATNVDGYRSLLQGSVRYRPVYDEKSEFAIQTDVLTMYTLDKTFQTVTTLRNADPTVMSLTLPWTYKGLLFGKGYKLDLIPGYESIWMSVEENTNKEIISSMVVNTTNMFVMHERLFSNFNMEVRRDQNKLNSATGDDDSTAIKVKLTNSNMHMLGDEKAKILTTEGALTYNQALGKNASYNRLDLAVGFIQPFYGETSATTKLGFYYLNYPLKADNRVDMDYTLTAGLSKKLSDALNAGFVANYVINNSSNDANTYKKWSALLTLSATTAF